MLQSAKRLLHRALGAAPEGQRSIEAHLEALLRQAPAIEPPRTGGLAVVQKPGPRVVIECGLSRVEMLRKAASEVVTQIPGDAFLPGHLVLDDQAKQHLQRLKARRHRDSPHFLFPAQVATRKERKALAGQVHSLVTQWFKLGTHYSVSISPAPAVDNADLVQSIRVLAKRRDLDARRHLYQSLVNAWLVLPMAETEAELVAPEVRPWTQSGSQLEWATYCSEQDLPEEQRSGGNWVLVSGIRLVFAALAAGVSSVHINPMGRIGGELYRGELETIGDYLGSIGLSPDPSPSGQG